MSYYNLASLEEGVPRPFNTDTGGSHRFADYNGASQGALYVANGVRYTDTGGSRRHADYNGASQGASHVTNVLGPYGYPPTYIPPTYIVGDPSRDQRLAEDTGRAGNTIRWSVNLRTVRAKLTDEEQGLGLASANGDVAKDNGTRPGARKNRSGMGNLKLETLEIVKSRFLLEEDGQERVELTVKDESSEHKDDGIPCDIRWTHIKWDKELTMDGFQEAALGAPGLQIDERTLILRLLRKVRETSQKYFIHGRYLDPVAIRYDGHDPEQQPRVGGEDRFATFMALPHFSPGRVGGAGDSTVAFPTRSLLQTHYGLESTCQRDKNQVFCKMSAPSVARPSYLKRLLGRDASTETNESEVLCLPQLWCLMVGKCVMITCSTIDRSALCGEAAVTTPYTAPIVSDGPTTIKFTDREGAVSYLPMDRCKSWFELVQTLSEVRLGATTFNFGLVSSGGQQVTDKNWVKLAKSEKSAFICLSEAMPSVPPPPDVILTAPHIGPIMREHRRGSVDSDSFQDGWNQQQRSQRAAVDMERARAMLGELRNIVTRAERSGNFPEAADLRYRQLPSAEEYLRQMEARIPGDAVTRPTRQSRLRSTPRVSGVRTWSSGDLAHKLNSKWRAGEPPDHRPRLPARAATFDPLATPILTDDPYAGQYGPPQSKTVRFADLGGQRFRAAEPPLSPGSGTGDIDDLNMADDEDVGDSDSGVEYFAHENQPPQQRQRRRLLQVRPPSLDFQAVGIVSPLGIYYEPSVEPASTTTSSNPSASLSGETVVAGGSQPGKTDLGHEAGKPAVGMGKGDQIGGLGGVQSHGARQGGSTMPSVPPIFMWPTPTPSKAARSEPAPGSDKPQGPPSSDPILVNVETLAKILQDSHSQLSNSKAKIERSHYLKLPEKFLYEIEEAGASLGDGEALTAEGRVNAMRRDFLDNAKKVFGAFVPPGNGSTIVRKFWGAIYSILTSETIEDPINTYAEADLASANRASLLLLELIEKIQNGVAPGTNDEHKPPPYQIPRALVEGFPRLVMLYVLYGSLISERNIGRHDLLELCYQCESRCEHFLMKGRDQLMMMLHTKDYREKVQYEAVTPRAILLLIIERLLQESLAQESPGEGEEPIGLMDIYSRYMASLERRVKKHPSVSVFDNIRDLGEELEIVSRTLSKQEDIILDYSLLSKSNRAHSSYYSAVGDGYQFAIQARVMRSLKQKQDAIRELSRRVDYTQYLVALPLFFPFGHFVIFLLILVKKAAQVISAKKESNNKAILIFTTVTVIFLPLTFVTGYLGMNTTDIRGMTNTQGLFWTIALPIASAVVVLALYLILRAPKNREQRPPTLRTSRSNKVD